MITERYLFRRRQTNLCFIICTYRHKGGAVMDYVFLKWTRWMENLFRPFTHAKNRKNNEKFNFDPETMIPVFKASTCSREKVAGFKSKIDNSFTDVMVINNKWDEEDFCKSFNLDVSQIKVVY